MAKKAKKAAVASKMKSKGMSAKGAAKFAARAVSTAKQKKR